MAELLSCSQFRDLGLVCRENIKGLRNRIMQKRLRYYINNSQLLNPKGRAIKALTRTNRAYSAENQASMSGFRLQLSQTNLNILHVHTFTLDHAINMDHTVTYLSGSYRSRQPTSTQTISFKVQPDA